MPCVAAALGISALLASSAGGVSVRQKYLGAAYLIYLESRRCGAMMTA